MRRPLLPLLALALLLGPAAGQDGDVEPVQVTAHNEGGEFWFECVGVVCNEGRNPPIILDPGRTYRFHVTNEGDARHDFHLGELDARTNLLDPGAETNLTVTVPDDASGESIYWCSPHRSRGMEGLLVFEGEGIGGGPIDNDSPGPGAPLLALALGAVLLLVDRARRR